MTKLLLSAFSEFPTANTGGANKVIYQILRGINYNQYDVEYLSSHLQVAIPNKDELDNILSKKVKLKKKLGFQLFQKSNLYRTITLSPFYFYNYLKSIESFYEKLKLQKNYDVLHSHDARPLYLLRNVNTKKKILTLHSKGSVVNTVKDYIGSSRLMSKIYSSYSKMEDESLSIADIITFPSIAARDQFLSNKKDIKLNREKVKIVYNGVDTEFIRSVKVDRNFINRYSLNDGFDLKILSVADHIKVKNIDKVIDAIHYLKNKRGIKALLINIGNGPETKTLISKSRELGIFDQVKFLGRIPFIDIIKLLKSTDLLMSAAENVVFDMIIIEALAAGSIIIASNRGGNKESIMDGQNGYLVNDITGESFGDAVLRINTDLRANALEGSKRFDISEMIKEYEECYDE